MPFDSAVRKVELRFSAHDLINKDLFSLSDPFLVCHTVRNGEPHTEIGRTETVQDDLHPNWATTFSFDYDPSLHHSTSLVVDLFDRDSQTATALSKHDFLGRATFRLSELLESTSMRLDLPLRPASTLLPTASTTSSSVTEDELEQHSPPSRFDQDITSYQNDFDYANVGVKNYDEEYDGSSSKPPASAQYNFFAPPELASSSTRSNTPPSKTTARSTAATPPSHPSSPQRKRRLTRLPSTTNGSNHPSLSSKSIPPPNRICKTTSCEELRKATRGSRSSKVKGKVSIYAETLVPSSGVKIKLRVRSALLRDVSSSFGSVLGGFRVVQFYEIQRERSRNDDVTVWSCIYRSEDGVKVDKNNYVRFNDVTIDEGVLTNMQSDRKIRIAFYRRHTRHKHDLISYVTTNLNHLRKGTDAAAEIEQEEEQFKIDGDIINNSKEFEHRRKTLMQKKFVKNNGVAVVDGAVTLKMEGEFGDEDALGSVVVKRLRRSSVNSPWNSSGTSSQHICSSALESRDTFSMSRQNSQQQPQQCTEQGFSLRADHFLNKKFASSLNDAPRYERRIFQTPGFLSLH